MKQPKKRPAPIAKREIQLEVDRMRRMNAPLETQWYVASGDIARQLGVKASEVLELFAELAHTYTYDGTARDEAERRAWRDTVEIIESAVRKRTPAARHAA